MPANSIALSVASVSVNSTCPKPLKSPVSLSVANRTDDISPHSPNAARIASSSTSQDKLPTNTVTQPGSLADGSNRVAFCGIALVDLGVLYWILNQRPLSSCPFRAIAASAAVVVSKLITAVPLDRPSSINGCSNEVMVPQPLKKSRISSSEARHGRPRT